MSERVIVRKMVDSPWIIEWRAPETDFSRGFLGEPFNRAPGGLTAASIPGELTSISVPDGLTFDAVSDELPFDAVSDELPFDAVSDELPFDAVPGSSAPSVEYSRPEKPTPVWDAVDIVPTRTLDDPSLSGPTGPAAERVIAAPAGATVVESRSSAINEIAGIVR
ncbi:MAG: hypothetical protein ABEJ27_02305 [Halodesulfurarchaeum sp.]